MKRGVAFVVYYAGAAWIVYYVIRLAGSVSAWAFLAAPVIVAFYWWITAGIGIRLGVYPSEALAWFGRFAGILDPPRRRSGSEAARSTEDSSTST